RSAQKCLVGEPFSTCSLPAARSNCCCFAGFAPLSKRLLETSSGHLIRLGTTVLHCNCLSTTVLHCNWRKMVYSHQPNVHFVIRYSCISATLSEDEAMEYM